MAALAYAHAIDLSCACVILINCSSRIAVASSNSRASCAECNRGGIDCRSTTSAYGVR
jgi:hypothetical protein